MPTPSQIPQKIINHLKKGTSAENLPDPAVITRPSRIADMA
jgi:hypothetical protein